MAIIQKQKVSDASERTGYAETLSLGMQTGRSMMENMMEIPQKTKNNAYHRIQLAHIWEYIQRK